MVFLPEEACLEVGNDGQHGHAEIAYVWAALLITLVEVWCSVLMISESWFKIDSPPSPSEEIH